MLLICLVLGWFLFISRDSLYRGWKRWSPNLTPVWGEGVVSVRRGAAGGGGGGGERETERERDREMDKGESVCVCGRGERATCTTYLGISHEWFPGVCACVQEQHNISAHIHLHKWIHACRQQTQCLLLCLSPEVELLYNVLILSKHPNIALHALFIEGNVQPRTTCRNKHLSLCGHSSFTLPTLPPSFSIPFTCTSTDVGSHSVQVINSVHQFIACEVAHKGPVPIPVFSDTVEQNVVQVVTEWLCLFLRVCETVYCISRVTLCLL